MSDEFFLNDDGASPDGSSGERVFALEQWLQSASALPPVSIGLRARTLQAAAQAYSHEHQPQRWRFPTTLCLAFALTVGVAGYFITGLLNRLEAAVTSSDLTHSNFTGFDLMGTDAGGYDMSAHDVSSPFEWGLVESSLATQHVRTRRLNGSAWD